MSIFITPSFHQPMLRCCALAAALQCLDMLRYASIIIVILHLQHSIIPNHSESFHFSVDLCSFAILLPCFPMLPTCFHLSCQAGAIAVLNVLRMAGLANSFSAIWTLSTRIGQPGGVYQEGKEWKTQLS